MADVGLTTWEGLGAAELAAAWGAPAVHLFASVGSTNDVARRLAIAGAPAGTVVLAEEQRAGRGRVGRAWASPPGLGLWVSLVARHTQVVGVGVLPLLTGLAVARALDPFAAPHAISLKWPNDLFLTGRKLGGILCEAAWVGGAPAFLVVGIGLNVLHDTADFPETLRPMATSLRLASAVVPERARIAMAVVRAAVATVARPHLALDDGDVAEWARRDVLCGREVVVTEPETGVLLEHGVDVGISADGALLIDPGGGSRRSIRSGTVRAADSGPS